MARIRTIKPEAFQSESLAAVTVDAERTFFGLSTIADDRGRHPDKPLTINGSLWAERPWHTAEHLMDELDQLTREGIVCRYVGCDGRKYLHLVTWDRHQKIERPSKSRHPRCTKHPVSVTGVPEKCWAHGNGKEDEPCPTPAPSPNPHRNVGEASHEPETLFGEPSEPESAPNGRSAQAPSHDSKSSRSETVSVNPHRTLTEHAETDLGPSTYDLGPRTVDLPPSAGADAPPDDDPSPINAGTIVAAYCDGATAAELDRPPGQLCARVGRAARSLLDEGKNPEILVAAATEMGGSGHNDLATAYRIAEAAARDARTGRVSRSRANGQTRKPERTTNYAALIQQQGGQP